MTNKDLLKKAYRSMSPELLQAALAQGDVDQVAALEVLDEHKFQSMYRHLTWKLGTVDYPVWIAALVEQQEPAAPFGKFEITAKWLVYQNNMVYVVGIREMHDQLGKCGYFDDVLFVGTVSEYLTKYRQNIPAAPAPAGDLVYHAWFPQIVSTYPAGDKNYPIPAHMVVPLYFIPGLKMENIFQKENE